MTILLDANVLIALLVNDHVHHSSAEDWSAGTSEGFTTCPITQGSLVRLLIGEGQPTATAREILRPVCDKITFDLRQDRMRGRARQR